VGYGHRSSGKSPVGQPKSVQNDELRTRLQGRQTGFLFESSRQTRYSTRTVQSIVTTCARTAGIKKRIYPHLLRYSIATIQLASLGDNYIRALGGMR
jgi:site-specific recombinase XerD